MRNQLVDIKQQLDEDRALSLGDCQYLYKAYMGTQKACEYLAHYLVSHAFCSCTGIEHSDCSHTEAMEAIKRTIKIKDGYINE